MCSVHLYLDLYNVFNILIKESNNMFTLKNITLKHGGSQDMVENGGACH